MRDDVDKAPTVVIGGESHRLARLDRRAIEALYDAGVLAEMGRTELVEGVLTEMSPAGYAHSRAHAFLTAALVGALRGRVDFGIDLGVFFDETSMRAPDICGVVETGERGFLEAKDIVFAVEVSQDSLNQDLQMKAVQYGAAGIAEYWVVDLDNRKLHVHRDPNAQGYGSIVAQDWSTPVTPLCAPEATFVLADVLEGID